MHGARLSAAAIDSPSRRVQTNAGRVGAQDDRAAVGGDVAARDRLAEAEVQRARVAQRAGAAGVHVADAAVVLGDDRECAVARIDQQRLRVVRAVRVVQRDLGRRGRALAHAVDRDVRPLRGVVADVADVERVPADGDVLPVDRGRALEGDLAGDRAGASTDGTGAGRRRSRCGSRSRRPASARDRRARSGRSRSRARARSASRTAPAARAWRVGRGRRGRAGPRRRGGLAPAPGEGDEGDQQVPAHRSEANAGRGTASPRAGRRPCRGPLSA